MNIKKILIGGAAGALMLGTAIAPVFAADSTIIVHPSDMATNISDVTSNPDSWFFYNDEIDTIDNSLGSFVFGPGSPFNGVGSAQISVTGSERKNLATYQFSGIKLSDIKTLEFSTYNPSSGNGGGSNRSGYLNFNVDFNYPSYASPDSWQKRLAYIPSQNGTVQQDTWQEWDAIDGGNAKWWWSGYSSNSNKWPDGNTNEYRTLSDLISAFPNLAIRTTDSWLGIRVGEPYADGYTENIDNFKFGTTAGTTTFNFEPPVAHGEITSPANDGDHVSGTLHLAATYDDGDVPNTDDGVQWAVRTGTCSATTGTVLGNVDGHTDSASWDGNTFSFDANVSSFTPGNYCFVFNPTDDPGQPNVRETRDFVIDAHVPTTVRECLLKGWKNYSSPSFKNQGQCVNFVVHNLIKDRLSNLFDRFGHDF